MSEGAALTKAYDPNAVERAQYAFWEEGGYFRPEAQPDGPPYCITIPPPNVTGELHMGHALQHAIHDAVIRWKRMQGHQTLCLPGTDHAGIATQMRVEQQLYNSEGKSRHDVGRDEMLARIWEWRNQYGSTILQQLKELGCSYDWSRERFTMDEGYVRAVMQAFVRFYEKGWVYRGQRMVNWCPFCGTVISDLEVEERELQGHLWHIRYPGLEGGPDVVVATTRPETMLGDTAVAVHPEDTRWSNAVGGQVVLPLMDRPIPIVADEYADPEMGSGAVKVTPAHDPNDHEVGSRHDLPDLQVIGFDATMTEEAGRFAGLERYACRDAVVDALQAEGLVERIEDYVHAVPHHDKCGTVIEPLLMEQWFVAMRELADQTLPVLREGTITYVPDRFRDYTVDWLEGLQDWCISRQIWWGHRIPVWTCESCDEVIVQEDAPERCGACDGSTLLQDPDVLDTWFSSALWPFATLGWPDETEDRRTYHPTDLMIT
ncbi:MAG: valine--tRNA ligase, partial [Candidatus Latescibacteria bacterium]|nr:valine--tRNA ligase [Candidatus Latescibacterota bacterium]